VPGERTTRVAIRNQIADLAILRDALKTFCTEHAVARKTLLQLQVTLDEVVSNIIKYAWPEGGTHELSVRLTARSDGIQIEVVDDGRAFDPRSAPAPASERTRAGRRRPGGVGLQMVKQLVDDIQYFRSGGRNHVVLTKRCSGAARLQGN
jgi:serine/threonine-protein kinase RsbW